VSALGLLLGLTAQAAVVDRIAAVVNSDVVTLSEVYDLGAEYIERESQPTDGGKARRQAELDVLDVLIGRHLMNQELRRLDLIPSEAEVNDYISRFARQNGVQDMDGNSQVDHRDMLLSLTSSGMMTEDQYLREARQQYQEFQFTQAVIVPRVNITEDEVKDLYKRTVDSAGAGLIVDLRGFFIEYPKAGAESERIAAQERARAARARVVAGEDIGKVAAEVDTFLYGARQGEMGSFRKGELFAELDALVFSLPQGGLSEPVLTERGVYVVQVANRRSESAAPYEQVREVLRQQLLEERAQTEQEDWVQTARRRAAVKVMLENPESL
jgi:peptidyl-prolyl cis-trans isomerase SurA